MSLVSPAAAASDEIDALKAEIERLRAFILPIARQGVYEVFRRGLFATTWRCPACGYDAPSAGHRPNCRAVEARKLLGKPHPTDSWIYPLEPTPDTEEETEQ